jgi:hypothetical protein
VKKQDFGFVSSRSKEEIKRRGEGVGDALFLTTTTPPE